MQFSTISNRDDEVIIKIKKNEFSGEFVSNIIERIKLESLVHKSSMSQSHINILEQEITSSWNDNEAIYYKTNKE